MPAAATRTAPAWTTTDMIEETNDNNSETNVTQTVPIESRFMFVDVAALRAKQLRRGAVPRVTDEHHDATHKLERVAMEEVRRGPDRLLDARAEEARRARGRIVGRQATRPAGKVARTRPFPRPPAVPASFASRLLAYTAVADMANSRRAPTGLSRASRLRRRSRRLGAASTPPHPIRRRASCSTS